MEQYKYGALELIWVSLSKLQKISCAQVLRGVVAAAAATRILQFWLVLSLGYGLDFLPSMLALERGTLP